jgi:hypothetical protein
LEELRRALVGSVIGPADADVAIDNKDPAICGSFHEAL